MRIHHDDEGYLTSTTTAADGSYSLTTAARSGYRIRFNDPAGRPQQFHDDADTLATATEVTVPADGTLIVDAALGFDGT